MVCCCSSVCSICVFIRHLTFLGNLQKIYLQLVGLIAHLLLKKICQMKTFLLLSTLGHTI